MLTDAVKGQNKAEVKALFDKVRGTYNDHVLTFDMHMPTWPFFAVAWAGDVSAVLLIAIRTYRLIFHPEEMHDPKITGTE